MYSDSLTVPPARSRVPQLVQNMKLSLTRAPRLVVRYLALKTILRVDVGDKVVERARQNEGNEFPVIEVKFS